MRGTLSAGLGGCALFTCYVKYIIYVTMETLAERAESGKARLMGKILEKRRHYCVEHMFTRGTHGLRLELRLRLGGGLAISKAETVSVRLKKGGAG